MKKKALGHPRGIVMLKILAVLAFLALSSATYALGPPKHPELTCRSTGYITSCGDLGNGDGWAHFSMWWKRIFGDTHCPDGSWPQTINGKVEQCPTDY